MPGQNLTEEEAIQQIYDYAAKLLVEEGKSREVVIQALESEGLDAEASMTVVSNLCEQCKQECLKGVGIGLLWCIGGIVLTAVTYSMAEDGGTYLLVWGPMLYGGYHAIAAFVRMLRYL